MIYKFIRRKIFPRLRQSISKVTGLENIPQSGPVIFAANHIDRLDGVILFVLFKEMIRQPIVFLSKVARYNMILTHAAIPLNKFSKQEAMQKCQDHLEKGGALVIFPESLRNPDQQLLRGKTGMARLALWTGAPIVPVGIISPYYRSFIHSFILSLIGKKEVKIKVGKPLYFKKTLPENTSYSQLQEVTREVMNNIALLSGKTYRW